MTDQDECVADGLERLDAKYGNDIFWKAWNKIQSELLRQGLNQDEIPYPDVKIAMRHGFGYAPRIQPCLEFTSEFFAISIAYISKSVVNVHCHDIKYGNYNGMPWAPESEPVPLNAVSMLIKIYEDGID